MPPVTRRRRSGPTQAEVAQKVQQWAVLDREAKQIEKRKTELKKELMAVVEEFGTEDDRGHAFLTLPEAVEGITALKRERVERRALDEARALELVDERGLDDCVVVYRAIDGDALAAAVLSGQITEEEYDSLISVDVSYRFMPQR